MRLIWHIIAKDLHGQRWAVLLWATLFLGQAIFGLVVAGADGLDSGLIDNLKVGNSLLVALQFLTGYVLVVQFVQADDIAGTRMFWLTRPISATRLLGAKAAVVALVFALLPVLLLLPWWLHCGFTARDIAWSTVELVGWQMLLIAPAILIASLTDDLGRAILWGLVLLAVLMASVLVLRRNMASGMRLAVDVINGEFKGHQDLFFTRLWLAGFLLVAVSAVGAAHQFLTRRFLRTLAIVVPLMVLTLLGARSWPWDCSILFTQLNEQEAAQAPAVAELSGLQLTLLPPELHGTVEPRAKSSRTWVEQVVELQGVPDDLLVSRSVVEQTWQWPAGASPASRIRWNLFGWTEPAVRKALALPPLRNDPETERWLEGLHADRRGGLPLRSGFAVWKPAGDRTILVGRSSVTDSQISRIRRRPPAGEARVEVDFSRPEVQFELPLAPGSRWAGGSQGYRVGEWISREGNRGFVQMVATTPGVRENGIWLADAMVTGRRNSLQREFLALNRHDNTLGWANRSGEQSRSGRMVIGGVVLQWSTLYINSSRVVRDGEWVASDPDWPAHTTLVQMALKPVGRFSREVKTEKYEFSSHEPAKEESQKEPLNRL